MITRKDMICQLQWRVVCIKRRIDQLRPNDNDLNGKLQWELKVTEAILRVVEENTHENQA